jgi:hypothetical protein
MSSQVIFITTGSLTVAVAADRRAVVDGADLVVLPAEQIDSNLSPTRYVSPARLAELLLQVHS